MDTRSHQEMDNKRRGFAADILPGLTTAAVVVPKALAYATIAALPVQAGLFTALVPMAAGVEIWLAALTPEALELVRRTTLAERLGRERLYQSVEQAVDAYRALPGGAAQTP